jgi:RimJ/RimL family protein N-acetyltransferase
MIELETERHLFKWGRTAEPTPTELTADYQRYVIEHVDPDVPFALYRDVVLSHYFSAKDGGPFGHYVLYPKGTDRWIGHCPLVPRLCTPAEAIRFRPDHAPVSPYQTLEVEVGWALSIYHRGRGYATEAAHALVDYGFETLNLARIVAFTERVNQASITVMTRLGMYVDMQPEADVVIGCIARG